MAASPRTDEAATVASDREIVTTRIFDAPPELVFEAFTNPSHVVNWWGPRGFTTTIQEMDVRPGGTWRLTMHGPDGANYPNRIVFTEVDRPRRLRWRNAGGREGGPGATFEAAATFEPHERGTRLALRQVFPSASERERVIREFGALEGARQTLERLSEHLPRMSADERDFVLTRTFAAPRRLVFEAWTDPKKMARWWGPHGFTTPVCDMDVRPSGRYRIVMRSAERVDHPLSGEFLEVVAPERLVLTMDLSEHPAEFHEMLDRARGEAGRGRPFPILTTVTFHEYDVRTLLTVRQKLETAADREAYGKMGAAEGWGQSFERLEAALAERSIGGKP